MFAGNKIWWVSFWSSLIFFNLRFLLWHCHIKLTATYRWWCNMHVFVDKMALAKKDRIMSNSCENWRITVPVMCYKILQALVITTTQLIRHNSIISLTGFATSTISNIALPHVGSGVVRIDPLHLLAGCCKSRQNHDLSIFVLV